MNRSFAPCAAASLITLASGCNAIAPGGPVSPAGAFPAAGTTQAASAKRDTIRTPALVVVTPNGILKYYPVKASGGRQPIEITKVPGVRRASSMAADGRELAIADQGKPGVVLYDLTTKTARVFTDPYGVPIDVAVGRNADVYLLNEAGSSASSVVRYPAYSREPEEITCKDLVRGVAIATDNEGDVFVNGYGAKSAGVVEIPNGPNGPQSGRCRTAGAAAGAGIRRGPCRRSEDRRFGGRQRSGNVLRRHRGATVDLSEAVRPTHGPFHQSQRTMRGTRTAQCFVEFDLRVRPDVGVRACVRHPA